MSNWEPVDGMSWWQDGTSNQLIVGEKYIPTRAIDACDTATASGNRTLYSDCSLFVSGSLTGFAPTRSFRSGMAKSPDTADNITNDTDNPPKGQWGGIHAGVVNFLIGDGAVKGISLTIPTGNNSLFHYLGQVNDGNAVTIP